MFPEPLGLMTRAQLALADGTFHAGTEPLTGLGLGDRPVTARACVVTAAADALGRLLPGEVLVTSSTTPAFSAALSIAGGLVVEQGGYMSHAAVTARELCLPAVIGAAGAIAAIPDGCIVCVDPGAGMVRRLDTATLPS
jgi:phosphohistidine swiveling domain-containing protein